LASLMLYLGRSERRRRTKARALIGAEIAERAHHERKTTYRKAIAANNASATTPGSPRLSGESQYGTTIDLAVQPSPGRASAVFGLFPRKDIVEAPSEDKDIPSLRAASPSFLPASTAPPQLETQLEAGQKEHLEEQQQGAREATACGHCRLQGNPGAGPYGVTWQLANSTPCLVIATARHSYIDTFIVENDMVETMMCPYKLVWPSLGSCSR